MKENIIGEYCFEIKKYPLIKFKAIKHFGQEKNDLIDQLNKYLFDNWNSDKKDKFETSENKSEEGLLEFKAYLRINTYEELIEGTQIIIEFLKYTEEWNEQNDRVVDLWQQKEGQFVMPMYNIYLMKDNKPIVPHSALFQTADEIMENAKKIYNNLISK